MWSRKIRSAAKNKERQKGVRRKGQTMKIRGLRECWETSEKKRECEIYKEREDENGEEKIERNRSSAETREEGKSVVGRELAKKNGGVKRKLWNDGVTLNGTLPAMLPTYARHI